jgi:hypothetical protein
LIAKINQAVSWVEWAFAFFQFKGASDVANSFDLVAFTAIDHSDDQQTNLLVASTPAGSEANHHRADA